LDKVNWIKLSYIRINPTAKNFKFFNAIIVFNVKFYKFSRHESNDTSNSTIDIFFNILQKNLEDQYEPNIKLTKRLIFWTKQERYPVLLVIRESCGNKINITLAQKDRNESYPKNLWIHITYTTQSAFYITTKKWLSPHKPILHLTDIRTDDWIIVNVQQAGKYSTNKFIVLLFQLYVSKILFNILHI